MTNNSTASIDKPIFTANEDTCTSLEKVALAPRKRGRPPTGRNTKVCRVPLDLDTEQVFKLYYEWLPVIQKYRNIDACQANSPRSYWLNKLLEELGTM